MTPMAAMSPKSLIPSNFEVCRDRKPKAVVKEVNKVGTPTLFKVISKEELLVLPESSSLMYLSKRWITSETPTIKISMG